MAIARSVCSRTSRAIIAILTISLMSGCVFPGGDEGRIPPPAYLTSVDAGCHACVPAQATHPCGPSYVGRITCSAIPAARVDDTPRYLAGADAEHHVRDRRDQPAQRRGHRSRRAVLPAAYARRRGRQLAGRQRPQAARHLRRFQPGNPARRHTDRDDACSCDRPRQRDDRPVATGRCPRGRTPTWSGTGGRALRGDQCRSS